MVTVKVDSGLCIGCGLCESLSPDFFKMDDSNGKAKSIKEIVDDATGAKDASDSCPVHAIFIND